MLPKKKIKTKTVNKVNKVPALREREMKKVSPNKMMKSNSPNKQFKKANAGYISSRKDIPSAKISLIQPRDARGQNSWNTSKVNAKVRVFSPPMGNYMAGIGKQKSSKNLEMPKMIKKKTEPPKGS